MNREIVTCIHIHSVVHCFAVKWQMVTMAKICKNSYSPSPCAENHAESKGEFFDLSTYVIAHAVDNYVMCVNTSVHICGYAWCNVHRVWCGGWAVCVGKTVCYNVI